VAITQEKEIRIRVGLDENNIPESILWLADDAKNKEEIQSSAMILALWDKNVRGSMRLDLWTKDMTVDEMKIFFHETLLTMSETLEKSIDDKRIAGDLRDFCAWFAEKMELAPPQGE
jgi:gliding motility-associated protein GldC